MPPPPKQFHYKSFALHKSDVVLPELIVAYRCSGSPSSEAVLISTCYGGKVDDELEFLIGEGKVLDPNNIFVVVAGLLGGGESSSPSNTPAPYKGNKFPHVSYIDNVRAQKLLCESLGIKHRKAIPVTAFVIIPKLIHDITTVKAMIGFSMGGQVSYHWGLMYPEYVDSLVITSSSAETSYHNQAFLEGPKAALVASEGFNNGDYEGTGPLEGKRAFGRVWFPWLWSAKWFEEKKWAEGGHKTLADHMFAVRDDFSEYDANDLLCMTDTWYNGSVRNVPGLESKSLSEALSTMMPKCLVMPSLSDRYFRVEDSMKEIEYLPKDKGNKLVIIESIYGHPAGAGVTEEDAAFVSKEVKEFLKI